MLTKIEKGVCTLGTRLSKLLEKECQEIKAVYEKLDVNVSAEVRRKYEEELLSLRRKIMVDSRLLRRSLRHHMVLVKKYKYRPRWWPKRKSSTEEIHESDVYMKEIKKLELEIERRYYDIKELRCRRQYLARAMKR